MRVIYNAVEIMDCRLQSIDVSPEYDPAAGIDFMRTKVRLVVQGVVNPQSMAYANNALTPGVRAGLTLVNIRQALMTPRQFLQVYIGPDLVFAAPSVAKINPAVVAAIKNAAAAQAAATLAAGGGLGAVPGAAALAGAIAGVAASGPNPPANAVGQAFAAGANAGNAAFLAGGNLGTILSAIVTAEVASITAAIPPNFPAACDPGNGPLPHPGIYVAEGNMLGDRSIIVNFGVDFWVMGASNIVLSNRFTTTHDVNRNGMTTRTTRGRAVIRADAIAGGLINNADDFRAALIVAMPLNFRRDHVSCTASEDGTILNYTVIDKETGNSLGTQSAPVNVFYVDGNATAGFDVGFKTWNDLIGLGLGVGGGVANVLLAGGGGNPVEIAASIFNALSGLASPILNSIIPRARGRCQVRVEGGRNASRLVLASLAALLCIDRTAGGLITSLYITQSMNSDDGQACEARVEWMPTPTQFVAIVMAPFGGPGWTPTNYMNLANDYRVNLKAPGVSFTYPNAGRNPNNPLPNGAGTRGTYVQEMAQQALSLPNAAPPPPPNVDTAVGAVTDQPKII